MSKEKKARASAGETTPSAPAHSKIGASSMHRWAQCPGSVKLSVGIPNTSSSYAEEGTLAHDWAAKILQDPSVDTSTCSPEMLEAVEVYTNLINKDKGIRDKILIEHRFDLGQVHPGLFGTCDAIIMDERRRTLRVYDYKHGAGVPVEVAENSEDGKLQGNVQLMYYGLGALLSTEFKCDDVELIIVQPRCPHPDGTVRRFTFPAVEILDFWADLKAFAEETEKPDAKLHAGDHCRFCPAAAICPEIKSRAKALAKAEFPDDLNDVKAEVNSVKLYSPTELAETLQWLPRLEAFIKSVRDFAYSEAVLGRKPPGWKLVAKRATRKWVDEAATAQFLEHNFPRSVRLFYDTSLKSVAGIEKVLDKSQHAKLKELVVAVSSGETLVAESDPRAEVKKLDAKTEFENADNEAELLN